MNIDSEEIKRQLIGCKTKDIPNGLYIGNETNAEQLTMIGYLRLTNNNGLIILKRIA